MSGTWVKVTWGGGNTKTGLASGAEFKEGNVEAGPEAVEGGIAGNRIDSALGARGSRYKGLERSRAGAGETESSGGKKWMLGGVPGPGRICGVRGPIPPKLPLVVAGGTSGVTVKTGVPPSALGMREDAPPPTLPVMVDAGGTGVPRLQALPVIVSPVYGIVAF